MHLCCLSQFEPTCAVSLSPVLTRPGSIRLECPSHAGLWPFVWHTNHEFSSEKVLTPIWVPEYSLLNIFVESEQLKKKMQKNHAQLPSRAPSIGIETSRFGEHSCFLCEKEQKTAQCSCNGEGKVVMAMSCAVLNTTALQRKESPFWLKRSSGLILYVVTPRDSNPTTHPHFSSILAPHTRTIFICNEQKIKEAPDLVSKLHM